MTGKKVEKVQFLVENGPSINDAEEKCRLLQEYREKLPPENRFDEPRLLMVDEGRTCLVCFSVEKYVRYEGETMWYAVFEKPSLVLATIEKVAKVTRDDTVTLPELPFARTIDLERLYYLTVKFLPQLADDRLRPDLLHEEEWGTHDLCRLGEARIIYEDHVTRPTGFVEQLS